MPMKDYTPHPDDIMGQQPYGRLALSRMHADNPLPENFMLYSAGWKGKHPNYEAMQVTGAQFRPVQRGPHKGELTMIVSHTKRTIYLTPDEVRKAGDDAKAVKAPAEPAAATV